MNMRLLILGLGAGGLIGYASGWALRGAAKDGAAASAVVASPENAAATKTNRKNGRAPNPTVEAELRMLAEHPNWQSGSNYERWELVDLKALVAAMLAQADPVTGLSDQHKGVLNWIVRAMARKDMEGTLAWIDVTFPKQRYEFTKGAIQQVMSKSSAIEQLEFLKGRSFEPRDLSRFSAELLFTSSSMDTDTALYLLKYINGSDGDYVSDSRFAAGFDFSRFAQATVEKAKANGNEAPKIFPMNFLQEWAQVSPQAALDFYYAHCSGKDAIKLPHNGLNNILQGVKSNLRPEDYSPWLGQLLQQQSVGGADATVVSNIIVQELGDPAMLGAALNSIQDSAVKEKLQREALASAAEASMNVDNLGRLRDALTLYQDPSARLASAEDLVHKLKKRNGDQDIPRMIELLTQQLTNLGHSEADVQRVRETK